MILDQSLLSRFEEETSVFKIAVFNRQSRSSIQVQLGLIQNFVKQRLAIMEKCFWSRLKQNTSIFDPSQFYNQFPSIKPSKKLLTPSETLQRGN